MAFPFDWHVEPRNGGPTKVRKASIAKHDHPGHCRTAGRWSI